MQLVNDVLGPTDTTVPIPDNQDLQCDDLALFHGPVEEEIDFLHDLGSFDLGSSPLSPAENSLVGQWSGAHTGRAWDTDGFVTFIISSHDVMSGAVVGSGLDAQGPFSVHGRLNEDGTITFSMEYWSYPGRQRLVLYCEGSAGLDEMTGQCQWGQVEANSQLMRDENTGSVNLQQSQNYHHTDKVHAW